MDRRERYLDQEETLRMAFAAMASRVWTALPGIVAKFYPSTMTCDVQPALQERFRNPDGSTYLLTLPKLLDCPVVFPGGGGVTLTFPLAEGDECLVVFASRCIDAWYQSGAVQEAPQLRMHNLSDGFCIPGLRSQQRVITVDASVVRLRTDDDSAYWEFNPTAKTFKVVASGGITLNGVTIDSSSNIANADNINASGTVTATSDVVGGGKHLATHEHSGVQTGGGVTGPPV